MSSSCIIDLGLGNINCVVSAVERCHTGENDSIVCVKSPADLCIQPSHIILPGVGTFSEGMTRIVEFGWLNYLQENCMNKPVCAFLGICLGMQLLATVGYEGSDGIIGTAGLGIIGGEVKNLNVMRSGANFRVPHIGWNNIVFTNKSTVLFEGISDDDDFYFMHTYAMTSVREDFVVGRSDEYSGSFISSVRRDRCYGVQFHPEKSQAAGHKIINNFLSLC